MCSKAPIIATFKIICVCSARNFGSVVAGSFVNAFLNIICLFFDLFRVYLLLYSVIQKVHVEEQPNAVDRFVAVVVQLLIYQELMHMLIFI